MKLMGIATVALGIAALAACGSDSTSPTPQESSYYSQSPSQSAPLIPKKICRDVQKLLTDLQGNIRQVANQVGGPTQSDLTSIANSLGVVQTQFSAANTPAISNIITQLKSGGSSAAATISAVEPKLTAAKKEVLAACPV